MRLIYSVHSLNGNINQPVRSWLIVIYDQQLSPVSDSILRPLEGRCPHTIMAVMLCLCCVYSVWIKLDFIIYANWLLFIIINYDYLQILCFSSLLQLTVLAAPPIKLNWNDRVWDHLLRAISFALSDSLCGDRNKEAIYPCPQSSCALSLITLLVINQMSGHVQAAVKLSPCSSW